MKVFVTLATVALMASAIHAGTVSPALKARLDKGESLDISIYLERLTDIFTSKTLSVLEGEAKAQKMISMLKERTSASQQPFLDVLSQHGKSSDVKTLWATNFIRVKNANKALVGALAAVPGDFLIREPIVASIIEPTTETAETKITQNLQWGVATMQAQRAWGVTRGEGAVVGIIDTGVHMQHEALATNFAGAWSDPYYNTTEPTDVQSHGTHNIGAAVGTTNGIGVAPGAKWIACRGLNHQGSASDVNLLGCGQWILTANPRPNVVSNAWGGGYNDPWYNDIIAAWKAANIIPVFGIGNSGPACGAPASPADQPGVIAVGATEEGDTMASFSSRGPAAQGLQKPDVSAPGASIVSAGNNGTDSYTVKSGIAVPHVAGAVALYISANPNATYDQVYEALTSTGDKPIVTDDDKSCGSTEWPNMAFGYGRINAATLVGA